MTEGTINFPECVDLHPRDRVVFPGGTEAIVASVDYPAAGGTRVVLGKDPACAPKSGRKPVPADPDAEPMVLTEGDVGTLNADPGDEA